MTKREYSYPTDEFDRLAGAATHGAAHRARKSRWRSILPFLLALVLGGILAYGVIWALPKFANLTPSQLASSVGITSPATDAADDATPAATPTGDETTPADDAEAPPADDAAKEPTPDPTPEKTKDPKPTKDPVAVDRSTAIRMLNGTRTQGLAGKGVTALNQDGWTNVTAANYTGGTVNQSTVFYKTADDEPTAAAIAKTLGISQVTLSATLRGPVSVVLASDFQP